MPDHSLLAEVRLLRLLADLPADTQPFSVDVVFAGRVANLRIGIAGAKGALTDRESEVLDAVRVEIARVGRRVTGAEIRTALHAAGHRWSGSTVNTTLANLVASGHLTNANDKKGYGLAG
jgi:hypothetical protein